MRTQKKNPLEVLLTALAQPSLGARVAEALPWVALNFVNSDLWPWLLENARKENLQNRLGFIVTLAKRVAESRNDERAEALERLVECDLALGLTDEAKANAAVLGYNYPGSEWYEDAYALVTGTGNPGLANPGWFARNIGSLF